MAVEDVYVAYTHAEDGNHTCPPHTSMLVFLLRYCQSRAFNVVLLDNCPDSERFIDRIDSKSLTGLRYELRTHQQAPSQVRCCLLPAAWKSGSCLVRSGLACVLRHIVNTMDQLNPGHNFTEQLLGFKGGCLQTCAETSSWTRFCEIDLPKIDVESTVECSQDGVKITIPTEVMRLENQFNQLPIISNIDKRRHAAMKRMRENNQKLNESSDSLSESLDNQLKIGKSKVSPVITPNGTELHLNEELQYCRENLPEFQYLYVEGTEFTMTDVILFPTINKLMNKWASYLTKITPYIPNVKAWYQKLLQRPDLVQVAKSSGLDTADCFDSKQFDGKIIIVQPEVETDRSFIREHNKKKFRATIPEIKKVLLNLQSLGITPSVQTHPCDDISLPWEELPHTVHPGGGDLPNSRHQRKCEQLENLVAAVRSVARPGDVIVDFCAGGGHVGIILAYMLPECQVILLENKTQSILRAVNRVEILQLDNITLYQCNLAYFHGSFDIGVCLHACGVATDLVLDSCIMMNAVFVICPCCYGKIERTHSMKYPRSSRFSELGLSYEDYLTVGHAADQTEFAKNKFAERGNVCMQLIDTDRASLAEEHGYQVTLCNLKPLACSPKNSLLIGHKRQSQSGS